MCARSGIAIRSTTIPPGATKFPPMRIPRTPTGRSSSAPRPSGPSSKERYFQWRLYWDYSGGISTDLLVHQTDITNFVLRQDGPVNLHGVGRHLSLDRADDREVPDTFSALYEYPEQFPHQLQLLLRQRSLRLWRELHGQRRHHRGPEPPDAQFLSREIPGPSAAESRRAQGVHIDLPGNDNKAVEAHIHNLLEAMDGKAKMVAPTRTDSKRRSRDTWRRFRTATRR